MTRTAAKTCVATVRCSRFPSRLPAIILVVSLAACAAPGTIVLHEAVGPSRPHESSADTAGTLVVFSATRVTATDQSEYPVHTPYKVYDRFGKLIEQVANTSGLFSRQPARVALPAGEYRVRALADASGLVEVPVIVEPRRTTIVDLDGTAVPQAAPGSAGNAGWVRLPNGHVVGPTSR